MNSVIDSDAPLAYPYVPNNPDALLALVEQARTTATIVEENIAVESFSDIDIAARLGPHHLPIADTAHGLYRRSRRIRLHPPTLYAIEKALNAFTTGCKLYPPGGFLDWHTNSDHPGRRIYLIWNDAPGSFFRYKDPGSGSFHTVEDDVGWCFRTFVVAPTHMPPLWHCVYASGNRFAMGFRTTNGT